MEQHGTKKHDDSSQRLEKAYHSERPRFLSRLRAAGRSLEEAEDMVHDLYAETLARLPIIESINNLPAWLNALFTRRLIDAWRRDRRRKALGEVDVAQETIDEIVAGVGLNPLDSFVRANLVDALNDALAALPPEQRMVIEAQVFGGQTFRQMAERTGLNIDTLMARKRYAIGNLSRALRHWIET